MIDPLCVEFGRPTQIPQLYSQDWPNIGKVGDKQSFLIDFGSTSPKQKWSNQQTANLVGVVYDPRPVWAKFNFLSTTTSRYSILPIRSATDVVDGRQVILMASCGRITLSLIQSCRVCTLQAILTQITKFSEKSSLCLQVQRCSGTCTASGAYTKWRLTKSRLMYEAQCDSAARRHQNHLPTVDNIRCCRR